MKILITATWVLAAALSVVSAAPTPIRAGTQTPPVGPPRVELQLTIDLPASRSAIHDDDIASAFAYRTVAALQSQGFRGTVRYIEPGQMPARDIPTLAINLTEWQPGMSGRFQCTFGASLESNNISKNLGLFSGQSLTMWPRRDLRARVNGLNESAKDALMELVQRVSDAGLLLSPSGT